MSVRESFAIVLRQQRLTLGLSQEKLAQNAGLSMRSISLFECNKQQPTISSISSLAKAMDMSITHLMQLVEQHQNRHLKN